MKRVDAKGRPSLDRDPEKQRRRLCVLPGFNTSTWPEGQPVKPVWMGRPRDHINMGKTKDWAAPCEPIWETGCPGAWYRTPWLDSLNRYYRQRTDNGDRVDNPSLTQCRDPLVHAAILLLEAYENAAHNEHLRIYYAQQDAKRKAKP